MKPAEFPQRQCRQPVTDDGFTDHSCNLPEFHPGPCAPSALPAALERRALWEAAHPGWEAMTGSYDPFADYPLPPPEERP